MSELLELARKAQGDISYYELAKRMGVSTPLMNKWKLDKSQPNGINTLKLVEMANLTPEEAIKILEKGNVTISMLLAISMTTLLLIATTYIGPQTAKSLGMYMMHKDKLYTLCE